MATNPNVNIIQWFADNIFGDLHVSMYIMPFSAVQNELKATSFKSEEWSVSERTGKLCSYLGGDAPKRFKVKFIPNEHGDDMRACVLA